MNKTMIMRRYIFMIALLLGVILSACTDTKKDGGQDNQAPTEKSDSAKLSDSLKPDSVVTAKPDDSNAGDNVNFSPRGEKQKVIPNTNFVFKDKGVDVVQIGADIKSIPETVEGLYDKKKSVSYGNDGNAVLFYSKKEQIMEVAYDERSGKITQVRLTTPDIKTEDGVHQFMKYNALLKIERFNRLIGQKNPNDVFDVTLDGITYELDENIRGDKYVSAIVVKK